MYRLLPITLALVWLTNGLYCKVLNLVPRHQEIVAAILGPAHARELTVLIGLSEIVMACWIVSGYRPRLAAGLQIGVVLLMNLLEVTLVPELLLWGRWNGVFALGFTGVVWWAYFRRGQ